MASTDAWTISSAAIRTGKQPGAVEVKAAIKRGWWEGRICAVLVVLAAAVPLIYPAIPPLVDLLGHMGRFEVALELGRSANLQQFYSFHWAPIGNLGVDLLVRLIAPVVGLEPATKMVVILIPPLTAVGFLWTAREVHGRITPISYLAIAFAYAQPFANGVLAKLNVVFAASRKVLQQISV